MIEYGRDCPEPLAELLGADGQNRLTVPMADRRDLGRLGAVTVPLADVTPEHVKWLWPGRLPVGKLVVLDGDPSVGKSTCAVDFAARVSTGRAWPDSSPCQQGAVLLLSAEDGLADTIRPRLDAADGNPREVHVLTEFRYCDDDGESRSRPVTLADLNDIESAVKRIGAVLVVVDVLMAYLPTRVDSHRDQDVRGVLSGLAALADRNECCILLLRHLNKSSSGSAMYRGGGSIGIIGAARVGLLAGVDPDDENRRVLAGVKANLSPMPESLAYQLVDSPDHGCARIQWLGATEHTAEALLTARHDDEGAERAAIEEWLFELLAAGPIKATQVYHSAHAAGYSNDQAKRAKKRLHVVARKQGMDGPWLWQLPDEESTKGAKEAELREPHPSLSSVLPSNQTEAVREVVRLLPDSDAAADDSYAGPELAPCGHPADAINTSSGRCGICIAEDVRWQHA